MKLGIHRKGSRTYLTNQLASLRIVFKLTFEQSLVDSTHDDVGNANTRVRTRDLSQEPEDMARCTYPRIRCS